MKTLRREVEVEKDSCLQPFTSAEKNEDSVRLI